METQIKCRKCGRIMGFWELAPYIEVYLAKLAVETGTDPSTKNTNKELNP